MRRLLLSLSSLLLLAGCGGSTTVTYRLSLDTEGLKHATALLSTSGRIIDRRLSRMNTEAKDVSLKEVGTGAALLSFSVGDSKAAAELTKELTAPFSMAFMLKSAEKPAGAKDTDGILVENQGWFTPSGITAEHLSWAEAHTGADGKSSVALTFTDAGKKLLSAFFRKNVNRTIGLFVRGQLMSAMIVTSPEIGEKIVIDGIPSPEIAGIFVDDVNVGCHVTFLPQ